jgi:hypothetical protein
MTTPIPLKNATSRRKSPATIAPKTGSSSRSKKVGPAARDPKKDSIFRQLVAAFAKKGVTVRREKLKAGPGWKAVSGSCRALDAKYLFVDPRMPQDDQILFVKARAAQYGVDLDNLEGSEQEAGAQEQATLEEGVQVQQEATESDATHKEPECAATPSPELAAQ